MEPPPAAPDAPTADGGEEIRRLKRIIERDRSKFTAGLNAIRKELDSRRGMAESRGSYEYDDDEYRKEFGSALDAIDERIKRAEELSHAHDLTDSPLNSVEVRRARANDTQPQRTADGEAAVQVGTAEAYPRVGVTVRGWAWLGLLRIRIYLDDGDWRTFWHVALWKFMFGVALPAAWVNAATTKAKVSDGK